MMSKKTLVTQKNSLKFAHSFCSLLSKGKYNESKHHANTYLDADLR